MKIIILLVTLISFVTAHFSLEYPHGIGPSDQLSNENIPPCGGFIPNLATATLANFSLSGDWVEIDSHHAEALFHYRVAHEDNKTWIDLNPVVYEVGIGKLCIKTGVVPAGFLGKKGILQVVGDGHGGALFQVCADYIPSFFSLRDRYCILFSVGVLIVVCHSSIRK